MDGALTFGVPNTILSVYHDSILLSTTYLGSIVEYTTAYEWHSVPKAIGNHFLSNFGVLGYNHSELFYFLQKQKLGPKFTTIRNIHFHH